MRVPRAPSLGTDGHMKRHVNGVKVLKKHLNGVKVLDEHVRGS